MGGGGGGGGRLFFFSVPLALEAVGGRRGQPVAGALLEDDGVVDVGVPLEGARLAARERKRGRRRSGVREVCVPRRARARRARLGSVHSVATLPAHARKAGPFQSGFHPDGVQRASTSLAGMWIPAMRGHPTRPGAGGACFVSESCRVRKAQFPFFFLSFCVRAAPRPIRRVCASSGTRVVARNAWCVGMTPARRPATARAPRSAHVRTQPHQEKKKGGKKERERTHAPCRGTCRPPCTSGCQTAPDRTGSSRSRSPRPCRKS